MQFQRTLTELRVRESHGQTGGLPAFGLACAIAAMAASRAGQAGFHGKLWQEEETSAREAARSNEHAGQVQEAMLSELTRRDIGNARRALEAASTDFVIVLENVRNRVIRQSYQTATDTAVMPMFGTPVIVSDFKQIKGARWDEFNELDKNAEGASLNYAELGYTEDFHAVAKYRKGIKLTYELIKNDQVSLFINGVGALGNAARRTRSLLALRALNDGLTVRQIGGSAGGPTIERLEDTINNATYGMAFMTVTGAGSQTLQAPCVPTHIFYGPKWNSTALSSLNSQFAPSASTSTRNPQANPVYQLATPMLDRLFGAVFDTHDWIVWDENAGAIGQQLILDDFQGGAQTLIELPNIQEMTDFGDFDSFKVGVQVADATACKVISTHGVLRVDGS